MLRFVGGGVWVVWGLSLVESNPPVNLCQMLANSFLTKGRKKTAAGHVSLISWQKVS